jgi:hypothetical protein
VFLVTNLVEVYYEVVRPPEIVSRFRTSRITLSSGDDADSDDDEAENVGGSNERVVDEVRDRLERLFKSGREWDHVVLERGEEDDFYVSCLCGIYHVSGAKETV